MLYAAQRAIATVFLPRLLDLVEKKLGENHADLVTRLDRIEDKVERLPVPRLYAPDPERDPAA